MIGTVILQTVSNGDVVTFAEGELGTSAWTPAIRMVSSGGYSDLELENIASKTTTGFTLANLLETVQIYGIVSDAGGTESLDPDLQANAIVSLNDVKSYLKLTSASVEHDAFLKSVINRVSDDIESSLRSLVKLQSITGLILDGSGSSFQMLPANCRPIYQIGTGASPADTDIQYKDAPTDATWLDLLDSIGSAFIHSSEKYYIYLYGATFPTGWQNIKLNCKAGYYSVPGKIVQVCIEMVVEIFNESTRNGSRFGVSSVNTSIESMSGNISFRGLSERHYEELNKWRYYVG